MTIPIKIRRATLLDLSEIQPLFVETIRQVTQRDYEPAQLEAWASSVHNRLRWRAAIMNQYFLVAALEDVIVGFGSLDQGNYIDFLYVHKDYQRKGIANTIYQVLEQEAIRARQTEMTTYASKTACPFFLARGFDIVKENKNQIREVEIINYRMKKVLESTNQTGI
ncbi:MAG: GNAT family N-acetyltransferase [Bacteroidota bacterium]